MIRYWKILLPACSEVADIKKVAAATLRHLRGGRSQGVRFGVWFWCGARIQLLGLMVERGKLHN